SINSPIDSVDGSCPPAHILQPCTCRLGSILCIDPNLDDLRSPLARLARYVSERVDDDREEKNWFSELVLDGLPKVHELGANLIGNSLRFRTITLRSMSNLTRIDVRAIEVTAAAEVRQLSLEGEETSRSLLTDDRLPQRSR